jgi:hypothetical protein
MGKALVNSSGKVLLRDGKVATSDSSDCCCGCDNSVCAENAQMQVTFSDVIICGDCFDSGITHDISINGSFTLDRTFINNPEINQFACFWSGNGGDFYREVFDDNGCTVGSFNQDPVTAFIVVENLDFEQIDPGGWLIGYGADVLYGFFSAYIPCLGSSAIPNQMTCTGENTGSGFTFETGRNGTVTIAFL